MEPSCADPPVGGADRGGALLDDGDVVAAGRCGSLRLLLGLALLPRGELLAGRKRLPSTFMSLAPASWHPDVWHDVNRMLTLNGEQSRRNLVMHTCPMQFDIVDRLITEKSNPGDLIYDPFGGLGTTVFRALKLGRRGRAAELNPVSFYDGVKYLEAESAKQDMPTLFDLIDVAMEAAPVVV